MELQSRVTFEAEADKGHLISLLTSLYLEFSEKCHRVLLNLFTLNFKTLTKLLKERHSDVNVVLENSKFEQPQWGCRSGEMVKTKKTLTQSKLSKTQNRRFMENKDLENISNSEYRCSLNCQNVSKSVLNPYICVDRSKQTMFILFQYQRIPFLCE